MAKKSIIARNERRKRAVKIHKKNRHLLKEAIRKNVELDEKIIIKLQKRKRNESSVRVRNRCRSCGRPRGTLRKFGLCRIHLREAAMSGLVPGLKKASW